MPHEIEQSPDAQRRRGIFLFSINRPCLLHQSRISCVPISLARELSTSFCHPTTSCCHCFEYGCAGAGVLSEGWLGCCADSLRQAGEVAAQPCSSSAEIKQQAPQILLCLGVALLGLLEVGECIIESLLKSGHVGHVLAGAGQFGAGSLVGLLLQLEPHAPALGAPARSKGPGQHHGGQDGFAPARHAMPPSHSWRSAARRRTRPGSCLPPA